MHRRNQKYKVRKRARLSISRCHYARFVMTKLGPLPGIRCQNMSKAGHLFCTPHLQLLHIRILAA